MSKTDHEHHHHDFDEIIHEVGHALHEVGHALHEVEHAVEHVAVDAIHHLSETAEDVYEGLQEEELIAEGHHQKADNAFLLFRNVAVSVALVLFLISLFRYPGYELTKGVAYFFGSAAYVMEYLLLTDCFSHKVPHNEMFMVYAFGPLYILLGISYLLH